jgi:hypothetical protein
MRKHAKTFCSFDFKSTCPGPDKVEHCPVVNGMEYCGEKVLYTNYYCQWFPYNKATPFPTAVKIPIDYTKCPHCPSKGWLCKKTKTLLSTKKSSESLMSFSEVKP